MIIKDNGNSNTNGGPNPPEAFKADNTHHPLPPPSVNRQQFYSNQPNVEGDHTTPGDIEKEFNRIFNSVCEKEFNRKWRPLSFVQADDISESDYDDTPSAKCSSPTNDTDIMNVNHHVADKDMSQVCPFVNFAFIN